ncbi:MAG: hypothetical protein MJ239_05455 [Bacilli bacterium]|nr:hypothetical protein [Bacilli bacterium]
MNIKKSLMLLSAAALLASCGGGATSSGTSQGGESETPSSVTPSNPSSNSETSSTPLSGWTTEQENLMKEHLGGHVLPYFEGDNLDVSYDGEHGCIAITFDWYEGIMDDLVDTYQNADYDSYVTSYYGLNIFIADAYDTDWNIISVSGMELSENEEDLDPSYVVLSAHFTVTEKEWPGDFVASYVSALGSDVEIPEFEAYSYITSQGGDYYIGITCAGGFEAFEGEEGYLADLEAAGWTIDDSKYEIFGYFAVSADKKVEINFFEDGTPMYIYIEAPEEDPDPGEDTCVGFPAQYFSEWLEELGATDTEIPEFEYEGTWTRDREYEEYGWTYWYFDDETMTLENTEDAYVDILVEAGYTIDDTYYDEEGYYGYPEDDVYCIQFYYYEGQFLLGVGPYEAPEPVEEGLFDFSVETQITESSGTKAVWESGAFTFMIEKGTSATTVGNGGAYLSEPLRIYGQQVVTISWPAEENVESIDFDVNTTAAKSKVENFTGAALTGCTVSASGTTVTLVPNTGANTVSFIPTGQVHLNSAQVNLAE